MSNIVGGGTPPPASPPPQDPERLGPLHPATHNFDATRTPGGGVQPPPPQPTGIGPGGLEGRPGPDGAPALEIPTGNFSADDLMLSLQALNGKVSEGQMRTAKEAIDNARQQRKGVNEESMKKMLEAAEKSRQAAEAGIFGKILGWIQKIVMAAVAAVGVLSGAAFSNPVFMQFAANAIMDLVNAAITESGGQPIKFDGLFNEITAQMLMASGIDEKTARNAGNMVTAALIVASGSGGLAALLTPDVFGKGLEGMLQACGVPEDKAKMAGLAVQIAIQLTATIVMMCLPGAQGAAAGAITKTANLAMKVAQGVQAGMKIATGATEIATSAYNYQAEMARADQKDLQKMILRLQATMEENAEQIKELMQQLDEGNQQISQILAASHATTQQITRNIV